MRGWTASPGEWQNKTKIHIHFFHSDILLRYVMAIFDFKYIISKKTANTLSDTFQHGQCNAVGNNEQTLQHNRFDLLLNESYYILPNTIGWARFYHHASCSLSQLLAPSCWVSHQFLIFTWNWPQWETIRFRWKVELPDIKEAGIIKAMHTIKIDANISIPNDA